MLKLYKNKTPNANGKHYYFTDFSNYLTALGQPFMEFELHNYEINGNSGNVKDTLIDDKYVVLVDELAPHEKKNYKLKIKLDVVGHYHGIIKVSEVK